jgi:chromosome segregation ATPase
MISLEQVRALESRVEKAVALIGSLRAENASMRSGLATAELRVSELEGLVADFQKDQARIEEGIVEALRKLDSFEDAVHEAVALKPATIAEVIVDAPLTVEPKASAPVQETGMSELEKAAAVDRELEALLAEDAANDGSGSDEASSGDTAADALDLF